MFSEIKEENLTEKYQIDHFSINFSNEQLKNLSLITGLSFNEVREKVSYVVAALLNILTFENNDLRLELESLVNIRSQFVIPDKNIDITKDNNFNDPFFNDSNFILSSLLKKDLGVVVSEVSRFVQIEKVIVSEIIQYITPIFLNKLAEFYKISTLDLPVDYSLSPAIEVVSNNADEAHSDSIANKFESFFISSKKSFAKIKTYSLNVVPIIFLAGIVTLLLLVFFTPYAGKLRIESKPKTIKNENEELEKNEESAKSESLKKLETEEIPFLYPNFPEDSVEHQLILYLTPSDKSLPSPIFKINGFKYSHGEVLFSEYLIEDIYYLSLFFKMFPSVKIAMLAEDNKFLSSNSRLQDVYLKNFRDSLIDAGVSDNQIVVEYLSGLISEDNFNISNEFNNGLVYFRVIEN